MSEWRECKLGDLFDVKGGKRLPKGDLLVDYETNHPYIRVTDLGNKWITKQGLQFVTKEIQKSISRYIVNKDDVILSIVGSIGFTGIISNELDGANLTENCVKFVQKSKDINNHFLYYFLKSPNGQEEIEKRNVGSTQPKLPIYNIKEIPISIPYLPEQKAIAAVLSSLDDKIDLLHRQNKTLEAMAETLFRQWFVVEAREDWEDGILGDLVEFNYGKTLRDQERGGYGFPVYGSSGIVGYHNEYLVKAPGIITGRKGTLGVINYSFHNFFPIDTTFYITSKTKSDGLFFEYFLLKTLKLGEMNSDSAVPGLNKNLAHGIQLTIPPISLIEKFNRQVKLLFKKLNINQIQIQTLETLRDNLLPKLISGEVRVAL
jgi:type I restriction enzyme S subunit